MKKVILVLIYIFICYCFFYNTYCTSIEYNNLKNEKNNVFLKELRVNYEGITPEFNKNIDRYYLTVSEEIDEIEVYATTENINATAKITGNTNLKEGLNIITIEVNSGNNIQNKIYTIEVTKTNNIEEANSNLEILAVENVLLEPPFEFNITNYQAEVSNETDSINILAIAQNPDAKIEITEIEKLTEGNNLIQVNVIAENGFTSKTYQLNVYKRNDEETIQFLESERINQEKLNGIYNIQRTSMQKELEINEGQNYKEIIYKIIGYILLLIAILSIIFYFIKK